MTAGPTRRRVLLGGAGVLGLAGALGVAGLLAGDEPPDPWAEHPGPPAGDAVAGVEWVASPARGRPVRLVTVTPPRADRAALPVVLGLHGLGGDAARFADPGTRRLLGAAWARGVPPFVLVALDGGDNYWHPFRPGDDPMRMLLDELPGWLGERAIGTAPRTGAPPGEPSVVLGFSMGGAGALQYARARVRRARPLGGVAVVSPGLFTDWRVAARRPFAGRRDWEAHDPLRFHRELAGVPTGVWCGERDPFVEAARRYIALARPEVGAITPGRHDGAFYARVLPEVLAFAGRHLGAPSAPG